DASSSRMARVRFLSVWSQCLPNCTTAIARHNDKAIVKMANSSERSSTYCSKVARIIPNNNGKPTTVSSSLRGIVSGNSGREKVSTQLLLRCKASAAVNKHTKPRAVGADSVKYPPALNSSRAPRKYPPKAAIATTNPTEASKLALRYSPDRLRGQAKKREN